MPITFVQAVANHINSGVGQGSVSVAISGKQTAGNANVAFITAQAPGAVSMVSDTMGNTYTRLSAAGTENIDLWIALNIAAATAGSNTVLATYSPPSIYPDIQVLEYSGIISANPVDGSAVASTGNSSSVTSGTITIGGNGDVIVCNMTGGGIPSHTAAAGFTMRKTETAWDSASADAVIYKAATYSPGFRLSDVEQWGCKAVALKAALALGAVSSTYVSASSETLQGFLSSGTASTVGFNWGTTIAYGNTSVAGASGVGVFTQTLTNLAFGQVYHYQSFASDATGTVASADFTFEAGAPLPLSASGVLSGQVVPTATTESLINTPGFIQGSVAPPSSSTVFSATMPGYSAAGNAILVNIFIINTGTQATVLSISDNSPTGQTVKNPSGLGNVYQLVQSITLAYGITYTYLATNITTPLSGLLTVSVTLSGTSTYCDVEILEYTNVAVSGTVLHAAYTIGFGMTFNGPIVTTSVINELLVAYTYFTSSSPSALSSGSSWTTRLLNNSGNALGRNAGSADLLANTPGTYLASWSNTSAGYWTSYLIGLAPGSYVDNVMRSVIGASQTGVLSEMTDPAPSFLKHGARAGDTIPNDMLRLYQQLYGLSSAVPPSTGLSYTESLRSGGFLPYTFVLTQSPPLPPPPPAALPPYIPPPPSMSTPIMPGSPTPSAVNNTPFLVFSDNTFPLSEFSEWGPLVPPLKWIVHKADGLDFGGFPNHAGPANAFAFDNSQGYLQLDMHNYYGNFQGTGQGSGNWFRSAMTTAAFANGGAVNGATTGFMASAPCYWEVAAWVPPLTACDPPNVTGLWPSISMYTDPALTSGQGGSIELDLFEMLSIDYTKLQASWHKWSSGGTQLAAGGNGNPKFAIDFSQAWHIYGLWVDTVTTHWFLDGQEIFNAPTQQPWGVEPMYMMIANGYGGGWPVSMAPKNNYNMKVAYAACWSH